jgi:hypothetical protein
VAAAYVAVFIDGHMLPSTPAGHPPAAARSPPSIAMVHVKYPGLQAAAPQISEKGTHQYYT